ncbi:hypothetical protein LSTR_LSTR013134 [Laodelphax striatellus]|uniref:Uncharacterized protein n=1 Tax=Laodelphax striatellus TaxID=195883 RepID=A0A482XF22_LAOST|nr:hypothetical protein LSTR_LSTR013134 [Laodelphax striatellus]
MSSGKVGLPTEIRDSTSLRHRGADFAEFELPLTTSKSSRRHLGAAAAAATQLQRQQRHFYLGGNCLHASLPRRSKSLQDDDPLQELQFQFAATVQRTSAGVAALLLPAKSASAEAEVPVYAVLKRADALREPPTEYKDSYRIRVAINSVNETDNTYKSHEMDKTMLSHYFKFWTQQVYNCTRNMV